jgi:peptidoglycan/xylan/chitin deacetylase (PgdA/CDA1 family)
MKDYDEEKNDLIKSIDAITKVVGKRPQGYLSTGITPSDNTAPIIAEAGYTYWMDPQHEDLPYVLRVNERELVVLQYLFYMNDYTTYSVRAPRQLLEIWKDSFDYLYTEGENDPKMMIWGMHPFLIGRPYRAKILQEFIRYAKGHPKVWFARCIDIANWWLENYKDNHVEQWPNCLSMVVPPYVSKASVVPLKMKEQGLLKE